MDDHDTRKVKKKNGQGWNGYIWGLMFGQAHPYFSLLSIFRLLQLRLSEISLPVMAGVVGKGILTMAFFNLISLSSLHLFRMAVMDGFSGPGTLLII